METRPTKSATLLGFMGLFPFIALAAISVGAVGDMAATAQTALLAYGAVILSFLGGVQWGACVGAPSMSDNENAVRLTASVVPSLIGWLALLAPAPYGLLLLSAALGLMLLFDLYANRRAWTPAWYARLRAPLSVGAAMAVLVGAFA